LRLRAADYDERVVATGGAASFSILNLAPDTALDGTLWATDTAELTSSWPVGLSTCPSLAALAITEVRSDPRGIEPRQEYVEIVNWGATAVDLMGISLADAPSEDGTTIAQAWSLAPGQRALLVPDDFDPADGADDVVPPGVPL